MTALSDIPAHLLDPNHKLEFIRWLHTYPIDIFTRRHLARLWSAETGSTLDAVDWSNIAEPGATYGID